jgi:hypothetical protein
LRIQQATDNIQIKIDDLSEKSSPILKARNKTVNDKKTIEHLLKLDLYPAQLDLFNMVAEKLPEGATLTAWNYNLGKLQFTLEAEEIDPRKYISKFQEQKIFTDVKLENSRNKKHFTINMNIARKN